MTSRTPVRIAKWLGLGYAAAWAWSILLPADSVDVAAFSLLLMPFHLGPVALAAMLAKASRTASWAWLFLAVEAALVAGMAWIHIGVSLLGRFDALGGGMLLTVVGPLVQYAGLAAAFLLAWLFGWRARDSWLRD